MTAKLATADDQILACVEEPNAIDGSSISRSAGDKPQVGGMQFDCGYLSPHFVTDPERMEVAFENVYVLIHERKISSKKDLVLTEARALVVREYLVENFGFDDSQLRTLGMGKRADTNSDAGWGAVQILIYPAGTEIPPSKQTQPGIASKTISDQPVQASAATTAKP